ncbi:MAG: EF-hand domain-containing protein [Porphyrobacter sp.]|nr:EF-hand domain-containing protein [Porphyrobacter sp.]
MRKTLTLSLAAVAAIAAASAAFAQEAPKREPRPPMTRADVEQRTTESFARMDVNKDGVLNQADRDAREKSAFDRIDSNHDGSISPEEFAARGDERREARQAQAEPGQRSGPRMGRRGPGGPGAMGMGLARNADTDGDGSVTQAEFASAALTRFDTADTNKDGTLSREERRAQRGDRGGHREHRRPPEAG